ncbi:putative Permease, MFS family [Nitrospira sp. KM1]|uniref:MFS transporter n=1 Tax=Nitrospira sp. KM1 TaxID=1936990 RepID=UPI0013A7980E|nr:MFS transporter [Nitrospira sp. KM1]BCA56181.1 putative Permease, MFS family [Nitrospira sp. KM1]
MGRSVSGQENVLREASRAAPRNLLFTRDFGLVWLSQLISQVGDGISNLALLWFVYSITGSPVKTTIIGLLHTIPPIVLGPLIGVYVDRLPKKFFLVGSNTLRALLIGIIPCAIPTDLFTVDMLYGLVLLDAVAMAVFSPALTSSIPLIVPRSQFTAANALIQSTTSLGIIFGPAVSGVGISMFGSQEVLCLNALTYFLAAVCLGFIRLRSLHASSATEQAPGSAWQDFVDGVMFLVKKQRVILLLIMAAACYGFGASALTTLFPVFAKKLLGLGPVEVGFLWSVLGIGLLLMSIVLLRFTEWNLSERTRIIAAAGVTNAVAISALVWTKDLYFVSFLMVVIGAGMGVFTPIAWGVVQELTPAPMVGRILGLYSTGAMVAAISGISTFGWVTEHFGETTGVSSIGATFLLTATFGALLSRSIRSR